MADDSAEWTQREYGSPPMKVLGGHNHYRQILNTTVRTSTKSAVFSTAMTTVVSKNADADAQTSETPRDKDPRPVFRGVDQCTHSPSGLVAPIGTRLAYRAVTKTVSSAAGATGTHYSRVSSSSNASSSACRTNARRSFGVSNDVFMSASRLWTIRPSRTTMRTPSDRLGGSPVSGSRCLCRTSLMSRTMSSVIATPNCCMPSLMMQDAISLRESSRLAGGRTEVSA